MARKRKKRNSTSTDKLLRKEQHGNKASQTTTLPTCKVGRPERKFIVAFGSVLVVLLVTSYYNTLNAPFVFDDLEAIVENPSIRDLSDIGVVLFPPLTVTGAVGRPVVNLSFAINYAISGIEEFGYHLTNLLIHICATLLLFGVIRRTFTLGNFSLASPSHAVVIAGLSALLWSIHPLLTESVSSTIQRSESLAGLFFLLTFYCFIRFLESNTLRGWAIATIFFCYLGMATKEVMVSCPLLLLLYDRTIISGSFVEAWRKRRWLHISLFLSYGLLLYLIIGAGGRNQTVGFGYGLTWWEYGLTQCYGIPRYLFLAFWPRDLIFDYGTLIVTEPLKILSGALLLAFLLGATVRALRRRQVIGFLGACFFCILAPSSSIVPLVTQTLAEHRMYLPLIPVMLSVVLLLWRFLKRKGMIAAILLVPVLITMTVNRNEDYQSALRLWNDTVEKMPTNARARNDLANALADAGKTEAALEQYQLSIKLNPKAAITYYNMAVTLAAVGRPIEAQAAYMAAIERNPNYAKAHNDLGNLLIKTDRQELAVKHFVKASSLAPNDIRFLMNAGNGLMALRRWRDAQPYFLRSLEIDSNNMDAVNNLGVAFVRNNKIDEAVHLYEKSISRHPETVPLHYNLGKILERKGDIDAAKTQYERVLELQPSHTKARMSLEALR